MRIFYSLFFAIIIGGFSLAVYLFAFERLEQSETQISTERLSLYQAGLRSTLEQVAHLPKVVVLHPNTKEVLRQGKSIAAYNESTTSGLDDVSKCELREAERLAKSEGLGIWAAG